MGILGPGQDEALACLGLTCACACFSCLDLGCSLVRKEGEKEPEDERSGGRQEGAVSIGQGCLGNTSPKSTVW